jgi:hypothetical protein
VTRDDDVTHLATLGAVAAAGAALWFGVQRLCFHYPTRTGTIWRQRERALF